ATIPDAGTSGVLAQQAIAGLWLRDGSELPRDDELARAAQAALTGSDQALDAGAGGLARARLADAMGVLFHRERHAESVSTPLVPEPAELLAPLWANRTLQKLVSGGDRPRLSPEPSGGEPLPGPSGAERPRVLAIPGVYGDFHQPVIDALQQVADVETRDVRMRFLSRGLLDPAVLDALAVLRGWGTAHGDRDPHRVLAVHRLVTEALGPPLQRAQVVFTDWADRVTVWASHMVPAETRLVVRIQSLDAFDPWLHLVDWSAVDHVIVVSDPLRVLVERLLALVGARVPVTVLPNLAALQAVDLPKEPGART